MTRLERRLAAGLLLAAAVIISRGSPALTGDGTYYLATAHSIVSDADLDLRDDLAGRDGFPFAAEAHPGFARRAPSGALLPSQGVLFSAGISPVYAAATWAAGALPDGLLSRVRWNRGRATRDLLSFTLAALAVWLAVVTLRLTTRVMPDLPRPWLAVAFAFLTPPLVVAGIQPRPDIAAALAIAWFGVELVRGVPRPFLAALPLALLPWLHMRYSLVGIAGAIWLLRRGGFAGAVPLLSAGAAGLVTWATFGSWLPPPFPDEPPLTVWRWLTSRLVPAVDWDAGLLWVAPFWILAFAGVDRSRPDAVRLARWAALAATGLLLAANVFSNGRSLTAPGESLAPALPMLVPFVAAAFVRLARGWGRRLAYATVAIAAVHGALVVSEPRRAVSESGQGLGRLPQRGIEWVRQRNSPVVRLERLGFVNDEEGFLGAVRGGHLDALRLYLEAGRDAKAGYLFAVTAGNLDSLRVLLQAGGARSVEGALALAKAREFERDALARALADAGATLDAADERGETALMASVRARRPRDTAALIRAGADVNAVARTRETALAIAVQLNLWDTVRELVAARADPNLASLDGWTPLLTAAKLNQDHNVRTLLAAGASANARSRLGWTPLMWAASLGSQPMVRDLLAAGADPNAASAAGQTALIRAAGAGHEAVVRALLAGGADPSTRVDGATAHDWAARNGHAAVAALLAPPRGGPGT
jgi:serine/threonine-protein phosphatase 6 regulatory ankyrin repeat subunit B